MGDSATLWIGGSSERDINARKEGGTRAIRVLRGALKEGALPGGGIALLACRDVLEISGEDEERAASHILRAALEAPFRQIAANAGRDPGEVLASVHDSCGFDALSGQVVDVIEAGIIDVASVQMAAFRRAVESAALALTIDVLVHQPKQDLNLTP
jgi:chaperonin GroEL